MEIVLILIGIIVGIVISSCIYAYYYLPEGTLRIDCSNLEKDIYRIEIDDLDKLKKKHIIVFKVDNNADLSQK